MRCVFKTKVAIEDSLEELFESTCPSHYSGLVNVK